MVERNISEKETTIKHANSSCFRQFIIIYLLNFLADEVVHSTPPNIRSLAEHENLN